MQRMDWTTWLTMMHDMSMFALALLIVMVIWVVLTKVWFKLVDWLYDKERP